MRLFLEAIKKLGKPVFFLIKAADRNQPMTVIDVSTGLDFLRREGNEKGDYVVIGFRVNKEQRGYPATTKLNGE